MDDINLDDEPFEQFDTYEDDYNEQMMLEAERQDQLHQQSSSSNGHHAATTSAVDALPVQRDFLAMLNEAHERNERAFEQEQQQRQEEARRLAGAGAPGVDIGAVQVAKKRVKIVTLDNEKLMSEQGLPLLLKQGKRLKIRHKYTSQAEKNANVKENLSDLMRVYQTWAHNLFPKANFRDFIVRAESKCRTDRQLRATMDGWRDAHWDQDKANRAAKEDAAREEQDTRERHEAIWKEAGVTEDLEWDPLSLDDHGEGSSKSTGAGSLSASSSTYSVFNTNTNTNISSSTNGGASKSTTIGKVKVPREYNASVAMRLAISDDEDESNDYEIALDRMRKSMNLGQDSNRRKSLPTRKEEAPRKNEIDLDDYDSEVDEDDEHEPLFTHRALQVMGGLNAAQNQDTQSIAKPTTAEGSDVDSDDSHGGVEAMDEGEDTGHITEEPVPAPSTTCSAPPPLEDNGHDDEDTFARRKPARRAILLDDSDEE
ncbi:chromosome segregation in meiosis- protein [Podila minutissima]|uniref:Chromosome segregation in meiosis protein n=1 Tax=Podila minutissima TaxID=64525 RepID=A0A9P5SRW1_9FUNG|nr:chromosome segregation in meiosis- protein [Podila minutissima]